MLFNLTSQNDPNYNGTIKSFVVVISLSSLTKNVSVATVGPNQPLTITNAFGFSVIIPPAAVDKFRGLSPPQTFQLTPVSVGSLGTGVKPDADFVKLEFAFAITPHGTTFSPSVEICVPMTSFATFDAFRIFKGANETTRMNPVSVSSTDTYPNGTPKDACFLTNSFSIVGLGQTTSDITLYGRSADDLVFKENDPPLLICENCQLDASANIASVSGVQYASVAITADCLGQDALVASLAAQGLGSIIATASNCTSPLQIFNSKAPDGSNVTDPTTGNPTKMSLDDLSKALKVLSFSNPSDNPVRSQAFGCASS